MYSHEFTQSANTWTHHYVVIPGHADLIPGTLFNDEESTEGIGIFFGAHYGTDFTDNAAVLDQWKDRVTDSYVTDMPQDWRNTAGATFDLTGFQVEVAQQGQTRPTPFEHVPYDMSLKRCQRYYQHFASGGAGTATGTNQSASAQCGITFMTEMRTAPTITMGSLTNVTNTSGTFLTLGIQKHGLLVQAHSSVNW